ncbi:MAG TPA: hypothetical protein PK743_01225 [Luteimonas sp.]|nr:hypothetical protein [Luteimonas sp.]
MDTTMELDDLKRAWQTLGLQLETTQALQWELLRERKLDKARRHLRPLIWGQLLQLALGIGLIVLGVACWTRNTDVPGLLATGIIVHAFGVVTAAMAGLTIALAGSIDYSAPVLRIQKRMALLLRFQTLNSNLCGLPWWVMWVLVVVAFSGLGEVDPAAGTPPWIAISLGIGVAGLLGTWAWSAWRGKRGARTKESGFSVADGADGIRRGRQLIEEIARFERD